ncbi:MAG: glycosyltransferase, partial [Candidatus Omnitrophota bacterium]
LADAKGRYLAFLDDDDLWEPDYLKVQIASLEETKNAFAVSGVTVWNTRTGARKLMLQKPDLKRYASVAHHLLVFNFIRCPSSVVFPRDAMAKTGFFDEGSPLGSDYDLYLRCLIAGFQPVFTGSPLAVKRRHGAGQLTDLANWDKRMAARLARVREFYPLIKRRFAVAPIRAVRAEVCARFAGRYFRQKRVLRGLRSLADSLAALSPRYFCRGFSRPVPEEGASE